MLTRKAIETGYSHLASGEKFEIYARNTGGFISVIKISSDRFDLVLDISTRRAAYPVGPTQLENYQQVTMVRVADGMNFAGIAKQTYNEIAKRVDLVSDHEQYLGGKAIWDSLARESDVNVYVFDGDDYVREDGKPLKYNGQNVSSDKIWGQAPEHKRVLLVATAKELQ
jgi:hypothetical protein